MARACIDRQDTALGTFVFVVGVTVSLLPVIGVTLVWLPLTVLLWSNGNVGLAALMAVGSLSIDWGLGHVLDRFGHRIHPLSLSWRFFLLMGFLGGFLQYGVRGLVIGPALVVFVGTLASWLPLYGLGTAPEKVSERSQTNTTLFRRPVKSSDDEPAA